MQALTPAPVNPKWRTVVDRVLAAWSSHVLGVERQAGGYETSAIDSEMFGTITLPIRADGMMMDSRSGSLPCFIKTLASFSGTTPTIPLHTFCWMHKVCLDINCSACHCVGHSPCKWACGTTLFLPLSIVSRTPLERFSPSSSIFVLFSCYFPCTVPSPSYRTPSSDTLPYPSSVPYRTLSFPLQETMIDEEASQLVIEEDAEPQHSQSSSESVDSKEDPSLTCKFCGMVFEHRTPFSLHLNDLHSDRPLYRCSQCPLVFTVKRDLSTHFRVHSGESPHECTQCGKQFGTRQLLKKHTMWHTGERTHACPHCDKAFYQKGHLTQHLMIHAGGRPHVCNICSKTFIFKFDLNRHMKIHTERGHSCKKCNRSFRKQTSLDDHLIKCKGLLQRTFAFTSSTPTNLSAQSLHMPLPLTPSSSLLANPLYACMFCGLPNDSKDDLAMHLAIAHSPDAPRPPQMTSPVKQESVNSPLLLSLPTPTKLSDGLSAFFPVKNEDVPTIDTATNSSASSPQKASPMGSTSSPPMEEGDASDETLLLSFASSSKWRLNEDASRFAQMEAKLAQTEAKLAQSEDIRIQLENDLAATRAQLLTANTLLTIQLQQQQQQQQVPPMQDLIAQLAAVGRPSPSFPFLTTPTIHQILANHQ